MQPEDPVIFLRDARRAGQCCLGLRAVHKTSNLDWDTFRDIGYPASVIAGVVGQGIVDIILEAKELNNGQV